MRSTKTSKCQRKNSNGDQILNLRWQKPKILSCRSFSGAHLEIPFALCRRSLTVTDLVLKGKHSSRKVNKHTSMF
ncbi:hypothetical protein WICANDRAFT_96712 [Wickerhamomyces anomalus NRRL Y-366-8]|uniref:Uncharacterized protein n=1 Tax=Wickerhamomyces anomalus (strain ATCC 58044 / CBS 1984 / NCYC 433 / NRRL Y-366-8) TaxID=683960 RepID=A0A1E3NWA2_WICAA|nr:uncharacterized protein WICANDRAFT_96712 [Wickerhamomyces anomalus NRRL Y-366-8]ODQ57416.1 hypothetical protein WICANDRAFT_96712 [Wickerhamomyces anomalus NRRL Y-366-8]